LIAAARYVALNPVRARLVARAEAWPWSSARAHLAGKDDELVKVGPLLGRIGDFATLLQTEGSEGGAQGLARRRGDRPAARERGVHRRPRTAARAQARPRPAGPRAKAEVRPGQGDLWG